LTVYVKARLHLQFLPQFLVRFSPVACWTPGMLYVPYVCTIDILYVPSSKPLITVLYFKQKKGKTRPKQRMLEIVRKNWYNFSVSHIHAELCWTIGYHWSINIQWVKDVNNQICTRLIFYLYGFLCLNSALIYVGLRQAVFWDWGSNSYWGKIWLRVLMLYE
jgi:hypothetical protein